MTFTAFSNEQSPFFLCPWLCCKNPAQQVWLQTKHRKSAETWIMSRSQLDKQLLEIFRKSVIPFQWTSNRWPKWPRSGLVHLIAPCCWGQLEVRAHLLFEESGVTASSVAIHSSAPRTDVLGRHKGTDGLSHSPYYGHQPLSHPRAVGPLPLLLQTETYLPTAALRACTGVRVPAI